MEWRLHYSRTYLGGSLNCGQLFLFLSLLICTPETGHFPRHFPIVRAQSSEVTTRHYDFTVRGIDYDSSGMIFNRLIPVATNLSSCIVSKIVIFSIEYYCLFYFWLLTTGVVMVIHPNLLKLPNLMKTVFMASSRRAMGKSCHDFQQLSLGYHDPSNVYFLLLLL